MEDTNPKLLASIKELSDYKFAIDQASIVAITDAKGVIAYVNKKFEEISQFTSAELIGQTHNIINSGHHPPKFWADFWKTIAQGKVWSGQIKNKAKDGSIYWVQTTIVPFLDTNKKPYQYMAIRTDITEQKQIRRDLEDSRARAMHAEKMASLGELAASVAHELGNPVGAVLSWLQVVADSVENGNIEDAELPITLPKIQKRTKQMQDIIRGMLTFARDGSKDPYASVNLGSVIQTVIDYMGAKLEKSQISVDISEVDPNVFCECRETELTQVIFNLFSNSVDAINSLDDKWIKIILSGQKDGCRLRFIDSGPGIPEEVAAKILKPFYTTKPSGSGTGLGLSISSSIITELGGKMYYETHNGHTSFVIEIPED